jgi:ribosomal protein L11 methyltransferase
MKHYKEFLVTADPFIPDILEGALWELNISGINEEINSLKIYAEEGSNISKEDIEKALNDLKDSNMLRDFSIEEYIIEDRNWNEEWEKNLNIIHISDKIVIKPTSKNYTAKEGEIVITLDPKMSFGTGEHATTKMCVGLIEKYVRSGDTVLDVGSGTALLAIAAILLGAEKGTAVDNDEWCYENGIENAKINSADDKIDFILGEIKDVKGKFDLIIANIQKNVLINIAEDLNERLNEKGILILSGILFTDEKEIVEKYKPLLNYSETIKMEEWLAIAFQKK